LSELSTILGKSDSTLSEILSLNKLPEEVKSDCRNDPKTARGILAAIAKQKDPAKMTALYAKYKESGLTRGEILKKTHKPKPVDAPIDLSFINVFTDKIEAVDLTKLDQTQREAMQMDLEKMRSSAYQIIKILKG
jgi:ParB family chromosome partitioning protein